MWWVSGLVMFMGVGSLVKKPSSMTTRALDIWEVMEGLESHGGRDMIEIGRAHV